MAATITYTSFPVTVTPLLSPQPSVLTQ
jgi:hypothetical protein